MNISRGITMSSSTYARKGGGIADLIQQFEIAPLEESKDLRPQQPTRMKLLIDIYQGYLTQERFYIDDPDDVRYGFFKEDALKHLLIAPTPAETNVFVQSNPQFEEQKNNIDIFSPFVTRLLQNSYDHGHNNFMIAQNTISKIVWDSFGAMLTGQKEKPLQIELGADVETYFMHGTTYVHAKLVGNAQNNFGGSAQYSTLEATGIVETCAEKAQESTFIINEVLNANWGSEDAPDKCIFKTHNPKTKQSLVENLPSGNRIIYVRSNGKEQIVRDYDE